MNKDQLAAIIHSPEEEIAYGPSSYLWDFMKKAGAMGYFLPLSGGADSAAVGVIVYNMALQVYNSITKLNDKEVLATFRKICKNEKFYPTCVQDVTREVLFTAYLPSQNSSEFTRNAAKTLAEQIGSRHFEITIGDIYSSFINTIKPVFSKEPKYMSQGGSFAEDAALQNIQARSRMVLAYLMAQLLPWDNHKNGFLLVLGSANLDEGLRGYCTKYDNSSADINPIGSISKVDLRSFLKWVSATQGITTLDEIIKAPPSAELRPLGSDGKFVQRDEADMGFTYEELSVLGKLRKIERCGPFTMFKKLLEKWNTRPIAEVAQKVKDFFRFYGINRHKQTTMTPSIHCESYSIDDNRFDLRPFVYNNYWTFQFNKIDEYIKCCALTTSGHPAPFSTPKHHDNRTF